MKRTGGLSAGYLRAIRGLSGVTPRGGEFRRTVAVEEQAMTTDRAVFSEVFPSAGTRRNAAWFRLVSLVEPSLD